VRKTTQAPKCANRASCENHKWQFTNNTLLAEMIFFSFASKKKEFHKTKPMKKKRKLLWRQNPEIFGCFCVTAHLSLLFQNWECLPSCSGMLAAFPFSTQFCHFSLTKNGHWQSLDTSIRTDSLLAKYCSQETLLHFSLQVSHLNICYYHRDLHSWEFQPVSRPTFVTIVARACWRTRTHIPSRLPYSSSVVL